MPMWVDRTEESGPDRCDEAGGGELILSAKIGLPALLGL
jgi:hypothetical protein